MIRKLLLATTAVAATAFGAQAADLPSRTVKPAPYVAPAPVFTWSGFYVGANAGYGFSSSRTVRMTELDDGQDPYPGSYGSLSPKGVFGGAQAGYNVQFGSFVVGLETDIQASRIRDKTNVFNDDTDYGLATKSEVNWFGTLRPRVGYAFNNVLVYATGGLAYGGVKYAQEYDGGSYLASARVSKTKFGYALGGGVEYAFNANWTFKGEYQYINLGSTNISAVEHRLGNPTSYTVNTKLRSDFHTVRLGVNYKF
jgi:outer membrane immunogenic protein